MNQLCKVCGEPAAGFHFGAFTCEGCKSFFGRTYSNASQMGECKNGGQCAINRKNRTSCKACRLRKCLMVGMSKSGSRYGRRSNWFKIHCLLQNQKDSASSDRDHQMDNEDFSDRSLSSPNSCKSTPSPNLWKSSDSKSSTSPTMVSHSFLDHDKSDRKPSPVSPMHPMNFFQPHSFMMRPLMPNMMEMRPELWRWYMSQLPNSPAMEQLPKMPFSPPSVKTREISSPILSTKKRNVSSAIGEQDEPLDLSAKRRRNFSGANLSDGVSPMSPETSEDDDEEDGPETVETHFRRAGMILDLSSRK